MLQTGKDENNEIVYFKVFLKWCKINTAKEWHMCETERSWLNFSAKCFTAFSGVGKFKEHHSLVTTKQNLSLVVLFIPAHWNSVIKLFHMHFSGRGISAHWMTYVFWNLSHTAFSSHHKFPRIKGIMLLFLASALTLTEAFLVLIGTVCFLAFNRNINRSGGVLCYQDFIFSNIQDALTLSASHIKADLEKRAFSPHNQYLNKCYPAKTSIV